MIKILDIDHVSIVVKDVSESKKFYCGILGMEDVPRPHTFTFDGAWLRKGEAELHLIQLNDASQPPGDVPPEPTEHADIARARHIAFAVKDIAEAIKILQQYHIEIVLGPRPRGDGAVQTYCFDPDGHMIELHSLPLEAV